MNLFFNGEIEPGVELVFDRDHYEQYPPLKKKKLVSVAVEFEVPKFFSYRKELSALEELGQSFCITRAWELDQRRNPVSRYDVSADVSPELADSLARQFLGLIAYRYVPNQRIPAKLLREESQDIAHSIFIRMKGSTHADSFLEAFGEAAKRLMQRASHSLDASRAPLKQPSVGTGKSLAEMLTMTGFQATGAHGQTVEDEDWGAGHQAYFLYHVLHTLDTNYGRFFGWRQGTIWAVEEPESGLHRDLETCLAGDFRNWAFDDKSRLQILQTTHSPVMTMASDSGFWLELEGPKTSITRHTIPDLCRAAERRGVSSWMHPVLAFPWNPVVLVEGEIDVRVLRHAASLTGHNHLRFFSLPKHDPEESAAGKDALVRYVGQVREVIANRPEEAPLLVLFDWDVSDQQLASARKKYGEKGPQHVLRMRTDHCEDVMGPDFRGIERFYPSDLVLASHEEGELILGRQEGQPYSVSQSQLKGAKGSLMKRLLAVQDPNRLTALRAVIGQIENAIRPQVSQLELIE